MWMELVEVLWASAKNLRPTERKFTLSMERFWYSCYTRKPKLEDGGWKRSSVTQLVATTPLFSEHLLFLAARAVQPFSRSASARSFELRGEVFADFRTNVLLRTGV